MAPNGIFVRGLIVSPMKPSQLNPQDYNPYYQTYVNKLGEADLLDTMSKQLANFPKFIASIPDDKWEYAYAEGKWTTVEALLHVIDTERVFQYRALCFARNDKSHFPGFDQDLYVPNSNASGRTKESIVEEYEAVRRSSLALFSSFDEDLLLRKGTASGSQMSVAAVGFIILGHQRHHRDVIRERYL